MQCASRGALSLLYLGVESRLSGFEIINKRKQFLFNLGCARSREANQTEQTTETNPLPYREHL